MPVRRENLSSITKLDQKLRSLENQYRALRAYNAPFAFNVDYLEPPVSDGTRGRQKSHFEIEVPVGTTEYTDLMALLMSRVEGSIKEVVKELEALGVETDMDEFYSAVLSVQQGTTPPIPVEPTPEE